MTATITATHDTLTIELPPDNGRPAETLTIPIRETTWVDERQWCSYVHDRLNGEETNAFECSNLITDWRQPDNLHCRCAPDKLCLLIGPPTDPGWKKARQWVRRPDPQDPEGTVLFSLALIEMEAEQL